MRLCHTTLSSGDRSPAPTRSLRPLTARFDWLWSACTRPRRLEVRAQPCQGLWCRWSLESWRTCCAPPSISTSRCGDRTAQCGCLVQACSRQRMTLTPVATLPQAQVAGPSSDGPAVDAVRGSMRSIRGRGRPAALAQAGSVRPTGGLCPSPSHGPHISPCFAGGHDDHAVPPALRQRHDRRVRTPPPPPVVVRHALRILAASAAPPRCPQYTM